MKTIKSILLQILVLLCAVAAIAGIKMMSLPAWLTYPLLVVLLLLTVLGLAGAHYERGPV